MKPIARRNKPFKFDPDRVHDWHVDGPGVSHFLNSMSLFFPDGERFFIRSVRAYLDVSPDWMDKDISAFIAQEAFHGREHEHLNRLLDSESYQKLVKRGLYLMTEHAPKSWNLASTCALEHITAILAQGLLKDINSFDGSSEEYTNLWKWHALEETEHKAVCFDLYDQVIDNRTYGYIVRCVALTVATIMFSTAVAERYVTLSRRAGDLNLKNIGRTLNFMFRKPGLVTKSAGRWLQWFSPDFHPWDHNNNHELERHRKFLEDIVDDNYKKVS